MAWLDSNRPKLFACSILTDQSSGCTDLGSARYQSIIDSCMTCKAFYLRGIAKETLRCGMNSGIAFLALLGVCFDGHPERFEDSVKGTRLLISVVDDDESIRESLPDLIKEFGFDVQTFSGAGEFLASDYLSQTKCLILDVAMPGMTGPDLQRELAFQGKQIPIIFITAHRDESVRSRLLEEGAAECLYKPFSDAVILAALKAALQSQE